MDETNRDVSRRGLFHILGSAAVTAGALGAQTHDHAAMGSTEKTAPPFRRRTFDDHQWATVRVLCDLIIPADGRSGSATQAGVPEFIDDWLDFRKQEDGDFNFGAQILGGLAWLDHESNRQFQTDFASAAAPGQKQILDRIAWPDRAAAEDKHWVHFFSTFRDLTVSGFASSKMGIADLPFLGNKALAEWKGCDPQVWAILEERMKNGYKGIGGDVKPWVTEPRPS